MQGNQIPRGGSCPGKDEDGADTPSPESRLEAGDEARNGRDLRGLESAPRHEQVAGPFHRAGQGPGPARPPSQFPREASSSVCSGTGSPPVTVTGTARAVCVSARRGARRCGNREPGPREASGVPQATVSSDHEGSAARAPLGRGSPLPGGTVALRTRCFLPCVGSCCQGPVQWPVPSPHLTVSIPHEGWLPSCPFQEPP